MTHMTRNGLPDLNDRGGKRWTKADLPPTKEQLQAAEKEKQRKALFEVFNTPGLVLDLIYEDCPEVRTTYPEAKITDASYWLRPNRKQVEVTGISKVDWLRFLLRSGLGQASFLFQCTLMSPSTAHIIEHVLDLEQPDWRDQRKE